MECCRNIENYQVGRTVCPECHMEQKRYISESDLLLYFGASEVIYIVLSLVIMFVFRMFNVGLVSIVISLALFIMYYFLSKTLAKQIYVKAFFKEEIKNKVFKEDGEAIKRSFTWQFMLFFAITISFMTLEEGKLFFGIMMPVAAILSFVKFFLQIKNEKNA